MRNWRFGFSFPLPFNMRGFTSWSPKKRQTRDDKGRFAESRRDPSFIEICIGLGGLIGFIYWLFS